jgi:hypothetical protein
MNKISSYDELRAERLQVERRIVEHKTRINEDFIEFKTKLAPFLYLLPMLNIFKKEQSGHPVLNAATSLGIDFVAGRTMFSKASWLLRLVVPRLLKSISGRLFNKIKT